jgi:hypothetical protein
MPLTEYLEVTTVVGCSGNCLDYCAQEVFLKRYQSNIKVLTPVLFEEMLKNMPAGLPIVFGGFSEPFGNHYLIELLQLAQNYRHPLGMFSTLVGASDWQIEEIVRFKFAFFCVHLPDGVHFKLPLTRKYMEHFFKVALNIRIISIMQMNDNFVSVNREKILRGEPMPSKTAGFCRNGNFTKGETRMMVLPNGIVYPCTMDMRLDYPVGNLLNEKYEEIVSKVKLIRRFALCQFCIFNESPKEYGLRRVRSFVGKFLLVKNRPKIS